MGAASWFSIEPRLRAHPKSGNRDVRQGICAIAGWVAERGERASPERHHGTRTRRLDFSSAERGSSAMDSTVARLKASGIGASRGPRRGRLRLRAPKSALSSLVTTASLTVAPRRCAKMGPELSNIGPKASRCDANRLRISRKSGIGRVSIGYRIV